MDKGAIKNFAVEARKILIKSAITEAGLYGVTKDGCSEAIQKGNDFEVYKTIAGTENRIYGNTIKKRFNLVKAIETHGFEQVMEETAYTWFNRLIAIRFMEVNDYLPTRVRVLSSETAGKREPDIVTQFLDVDLNMTPEELENVQKAKEENRYDDAFRMLFIKQCNELNEILPGLFEKTDDYMELLLKISYTTDGVVRMLIDTVAEENFDVEREGQVEIIGWMYQYYNTELKDETFALLKKNVKITKERIPAATQLFTPDWIVRYMVENSLGRLWIEHLRANDTSLDEKELAEEFGWKYYLPEAEQEEEVNIKLAEVRTTYKEMYPMDIKCIDPCMGSGHILVYMFDVLMDIYKSAGYSERDAVFYILENNIRGLDIDQRAYQLSYFALMMKGRGYNRRFFRGREIEQEGYSKISYPNPDVHAIKESNSLPKDIVEQIDSAFPNVFTEKEIECIEYVVKVFENAKEYGSILNVDNEPDKEARQYASVALKIYSLIDGTHPFCIENDLDFLQRALIIENFNLLDELMLQACLMSEKYDVVITNPPYMGISNGNNKINKYVKDKYPDSKSDLFAVFIEKCGQMLKFHGYQAMITQHSWMFLSSYEKLRKNIIQEDIINMAHLGARAFEEIGGEVVQTTAFVLRNSNVPNSKSTFIRLLNFNSQQSKEEGFFCDENKYITQKENFNKIPGIPLAYWVSDSIFIDYENETILDGCEIKQGLATCNNSLFVRDWTEISFENMGLNYCDSELAQKSNKKWFPYNKGGGFRKWYGNNYAVVNWQNNGIDIHQYNNLPLDYNGAPVRAKKYYFKPGITYGLISSMGFSARNIDGGFIFDVGGSMIFPEKYDKYYLIALLSSKVTQYILGIINPTLNYQVGDIGKIPVIIDKNSFDEILYLSKSSIKLSKTDWDSNETSWEFQRHYLLSSSNIQTGFKNWQNECDERFKQLKTNEEKINRIFINTYALQNELSPEVEDKDITVRKADLEKDIKSFLSYAVGCMFGRYSLDEEGLAYAGGEWNSSKYSTFIPDADNIIPITDEEYFDDDIVCRFIEFVKVVYGEDTLEENLEFIANALGGKGKSSREVIRSYFIKDFYKDHCKIYQKRPIYWLFDSGKQNGFKALIYMHRYDKDTVGRIRADYIHKIQGAIEGALKNAEYIISSSTSAVDRAKATKDRDKYIKQLSEIKIYDQAIAHVALQRIEIDLDDGVKHNYQLFQGVEVSSEGSKKQSVDLLAKI
ncbi:MAG: hypothetical protein PWP67_805 [Clostridium butyricum]|nr:hypothetical protein [Clostridium butyricum]